MDGDTSCRSGPELLLKLCRIVSDSLRLIRGEIFSAHNMRARDFFILLAIEQKTPIVFAKVVDRLKYPIYPSLQTIDINKSTVSQAVSRLVDKGFVHKQENPRDQRQPLLVRTAEGNNFVELVVQAEEHALEVIITNGMRLDDEMEKALLLLGGKFEQYMEKEKEKQLQSSQYVLEDIPPT